MYKNAPRFRRETYKRNRQGCSTCGEWHSINDQLYRPVSTVNLCWKPAESSWWRNVVPIRCVGTAFDPWRADFGSGICTCVYNHVRECTIVSFPGFSWFLPFFFVADCFVRTSPRCQYYASVKWLVRNDRSARELERWYVWFNTYDREGQAWKENEEFFRLALKLNRSIIIEL